jgi:phosphoesterase RecJ-like protein
MTANSSNPNEAVKKLKGAYRALLTCHRSPDGDAIGSELAIAQLAKILGVDTVVINRDPTPTNLGFLPGAQSIVVSDDLPADFPDAFDLVITVECPELERTGFEGLAQLPILNIDHHPANPAYGVVNYLDDESPAVGEMVWKMFEEAGVWPSPEAATNLYVALTTDTGDFRYSSATSRAFLTAAQMVDAGAQPTQVADWIHGNRSAAAVRLLGEALCTLRLECDGRLALVTVDQLAFERAQAGPEDTEEIVNVPRSIVGVEAVALFKQGEQDVTRVSLRSRGDVDVRKVAAEFGGGGHKNAAGCTVNGTLSQTEERITAALARTVEETG